ncbi:MAG TPA: gluconokinase [Chloroflexota bacterium]|nr:gluconokinase [Chloroflexota bacterium]
MTQPTDSGVTVEPAAASDPLVVALDVGTSSARTVIYDSGGRSVRGWLFQRQYDVQTTPDGGATLDPEALREAVWSNLDAASRAAAGAGREIRIVAADTFWHSVLGVDRSLRPVTPIFTWADVRAAPAAGKLQTLLSEPDVHSRTGCGIHSSYLPAKLLWLADTQPDLFRKAAYWMSFGEWLYATIFGERLVSVSMASGTGLLDQVSMRWDTEILSVLPIRETQLSSLVDYGESAGALSAEYARRWPALSRAVWFQPLGDGACNNVGAAGTGDDLAVVMIGTSGALRIVKRAREGPLPADLWTYRVDREFFVQGGALSAGGNVAAWLESTLRLPQLHDLELALAKRPPDEHGLTVLPFLAGERSPDWNPRATGAIVGLRLHTTAEDIALATFEAIAYRFFHIYGMLRERVGAPAGVIGSGAGLANAPVWMQIMSDVLGTPITASRVPEATSRGAAVLGLRAAGASAELAACSGPLGMKYAPRPERREAYAAAIERQQRLYDLLMEGTREG